MALFLRFLTKEGMPLRRIILYISVLFLAGIVLASFSPLPSTYSSWLLLISIQILLLLSIWLFYSYRKRPLPFLTFVLLFISVGLVYRFAYDADHPNLLTPYYETNIQVVGMVAENPVYMNSKWQFVVQVDSISNSRGEEVPLRDRIQVSDTRQQSPPVSYGDKVEISGILLAPSTSRNPGGYNDQAYLERQGIHARMTIRNPNDIKSLGTSPGIYGRTIAPLYQHTWHVLHELFPAGEAELAGGLVLGFKSDLPDDWQAAFQMLGVTHILAASGMNVGLLVGTLFYLLKYLHVPKKYSSLIVTGVVILYVLLSGASPSVVRAGLMAILIMTGGSLGRKQDTLTTLATAALLSLLWNPGTVSDLGFLLSFITTLGLLLLSPRIYGWLKGPTWLRGALAVTLAAQISSLPLLLSQFNQFSPISILANLFIMPLTFLLVPLGFLILLLGSIHIWFAFPLVGIYRILMWLLVKPIVWVSDTTAGFTWVIPSLPIWVVCLIYGGILGVMYPSTVKRFGRGLKVRFRLQNRFSNLMRKRKQHLIACLLLAGLFVGWALWLPHSSELRVTFLDVGQGDSALIETPGGQNILVDGGGIPQYMRSDFDVGDKIVIPFLHHRGVRTIDYVIATHADEDHIRGLLTVLKKMPVRRLIISGYDDPAPAFQELLRLAKAKRIPIYESKAPIEWDLERGVHWRFLHPDIIHHGTRSDTNSNCVVFEFTYGRRSFLFTGDIEGEVEPDLFPYAHPIDVLKVPHHGSAYSTTEELLEKWHPRYAVISVGKWNRYHHPHPDVLNRLKHAGATVYRTDQQGAVTVLTDGDKLKITATVSGSK